MNTSMPDFNPEEAAIPNTEHSPFLYDVNAVPAINNETIQDHTKTVGRLSRLKTYIGESILNNSIRTFLVTETALDEYNSSAKNPKSIKEKLSLRYTAGMTIAGQAYERARMPEVIGVAATTRVYRETLENDWNSGLATLAAGTVLGLLVYGQQKIIGRNFVNTAKFFPSTYDTINQQWPKTINAIGDAIPSKENRFSEGYGMFGLGTTPFIASTRAANPDVSLEELRTIERRVTRRGSVFAAGIGFTVLGAKSLAVHVPSRVGEEMAKRSDQFVDVASNPYIVAGSLMAWSVAKTVGNQVKKA